MPLFRVHRVSPSILKSANEEVRALQATSVGDNSGAMPPTSLSEERAQIPLDVPEVGECERGLTDAVAFLVTMG